MIAIILYAFRVSRLHELSLTLKGNNGPYPKARFLEPDDQHHSQFSLFSIYRYPRKGGPSKNVHHKAADIERVTYWAVHLSSMSMLHTLSKADCLNTREAA